MLQWATSNCTLNIYPEYVGNNTNFIRKAYSVKDSFYNLKMKQAPEMYYYIYNLMSNKTALKMDTVNTLFDKNLGLNNVNHAAIFLINVLNGAKLKEYESQFYVDDAKELLLQLRYHVQEYLLQGTTTTQNANQWIADGFDSDVISTMKAGEFKDGVDQDLLVTVRSVLNYQNNEINSTMFRIDTGGRDINKVAGMRLLNNKNTANKNMKVHNGTMFVDV